MKKYGFVAAVCAALMLVAASPLNATAQQVAGTQVSGEPPVTLKVTVTISKWNGEKKIASSPFILMVVPRYGDRAEKGIDGDQTSLQMGSEVPVPTTTVTDGKSVPSIQYRTIGTNIGSAARPLGGGNFNVYVSVQDTQLDAQSGPATLPRMQNFRASNRLTMRDGQTVQFTVATDTVTGQVTKLDVTMNVVK